jgi:lysozyme
MKVTQDGLELIKSFEGCKLIAYQDVGGVWTIGWGHTEGVKPGATITQAQADRLFEDAVATRALQLSALLTVVPSDAEFSALVSLAYNIGVGAFAKSTVLRLHNAGKRPEAAAAFSMWNKAGGRVRAGLTRRRAAEAAMYLTPSPGVAQTTRAAPDVKDPAAKAVNPSTLVAGVGASLAVAQQAVAQVSDIWEGLARFGVSPAVLFAVLGAASLAAVGWFVYEARTRRSEGDL